uniref:RNA helicase n=1 Tax=Cannabis sativa TaxID=3483 RepID=A0A803QRS4_CANSA
MEALDMDLTRDETRDNKRGREKRDKGHEKEIDQINCDVGYGMTTHSENSSSPPVLHTDVDWDSGIEETLGSYINSTSLAEVGKLNNDLHYLTVDHKSPYLKNKDKLKKGLNRSFGRFIPGGDSHSYCGGDLENNGEIIEDEDDELLKKKRFFVYRKELDLTTFGKNVPKPVKTWDQMGLTSIILETVKQLKYEKPTPIQAQGLPTIMSGRDCIGIGQTGSGKMLTFVLPMLRHIKDQLPLVAGDGPIGLIMAPTRELVQQIHCGIEMFFKVLGLRCVPVYGGSNFAQQISELKKGAEIVVCTPSRMIDMLCTSSGDITNLLRVTYLVIDEADRMVDMGFEPQIRSIIQNTHPDKQTVLLCATLPREVEILARNSLHNPVEIQVGERNVVNKDILQLVEVRPENERDLLKHSYHCLSLYGAKNQMDRESTISDLESGVCNVLITTSVAARGLDVNELELVINYDVPINYEVYVEHVGRTSQFGRAITFISKEDSRYALHIVKAFELSKQVVPDELKALADSAKINTVGPCFKFKEEGELSRIAAKKTAKEYGFEDDISSEDEDVVY